MTTLSTPTRPRRTVRRTVAALALAAAPMLMLSGCSKPSSAEVSTGVAKILEKSGLDSATAKKVADCAAPTMVDKLSKATLDNYVDGKDLTQADEKSEATSIVKACNDKVGTGA